MKKLYSLLFCLALFFLGTSFAQTNVYLQINHKLGANPFGFSTTATNNLGHDFEVTRLQYYIAEITLIHDGGTETMVPQTWILADAGVQVNEMLGNFAITTLEGIRFGIGVEQSFNHLDPSTYPMSHPLAPKAPSMHWGWNAGYRFVCYEGNAGAGMSQIFQVHALGDNNYLNATVNTAGVTMGSDLYIVLDGDYEMGLKNINVSNGVITHGDFAEAVTLLQNFSQDVFSEGTFTVGQEDLLAHGLTMDLYPNPTVNNANIRIGGNSSGTEIVINDLMGRTVQQEVVPANGQLVTKTLDQGLYFVTLVKNGVNLDTRKLIVTK